MGKPKNMRGFTLVELLVVMAILSVLIGLSIAGLGYAMRRSRNIARQAALENMVVGLEAYYTDHQDYPAQPGDGASFHLLFGPSTGTGETAIAEFDLQPYLEDTWDAPPESYFYYQVADEYQVYTVCVNQEVWSGNQTYVCSGTGVGNADLTPRTIGAGATDACSTCPGNGAEWDPDTGTWVPISVTSTP